ncbi:1887_t:CDS:1 [Funneliformis geosporum]|uniref:11430_t:CDS:1 n=1 Tax=Funneliformis geosporum TaxID=1117311 RepID=A0A9W4SUC7_9GLOM|nr:11430_t:CDS:1 [Funneliformis geosporum]CAI2184127.1 1887_t:CDS:1 [Funneliformis geosporum]
MSDKEITFYFFEPETLEEPEEKNRKREPNMFISYRNERMKDRPPNITMAEFSKIVSEEWKLLSEYEKAKWQRNYQINRDQNLQNSNKYVQRNDQMGKSGNVNANHVAKDISNNEKSIYHPKVNVLQNGDETNFKSSFNLKAIGDEGRMNKDQKLQKMDNNVIADQLGESSNKIHPNSIYYKYYVL